MTNTRRTSPRLQKTVPEPTATTLKSTIPLKKKLSPPKSRRVIKKKPVKRTKSVARKAITKKSNDTTSPQRRSARIAKNNKPAQLLEQIEADQAEQINIPRAVSTLVNINVEPMFVQAEVNTATTGTNTPAWHSPSTSSNTNQCFMVSDYQLMHDQLEKAMLKFAKARQQHALLKQEILVKTHSYHSAAATGRKSMKLNYRIQLASLEGTYNAYLEYMKRQYGIVKRLKQELFNARLALNNHNRHGNTNTLLTNFMMMNE